MSGTQRNLVVLVTHGADHELSSVAFTIANGGMTAGLKVSVFLTSAGVDLVRRRASDTTHVPPLEPLGALIQEFSQARRHAVGLYALREGTRLYPRRSHPWNSHHGRERHARADSSGRCDT